MTSAAALPARREKGWTLRRYDDSAVGPTYGSAVGFTYVGLLLAIALAGTALAGGGVLWSKDAQREQEMELLFVGQQFKQAIAAYYETAPAGQRHKFPDKLEDLVHDKRWPATRRHLRKVYFDPMTKSREWGIVKGPGGGIAGIHSLSDVVPVKRTGFPDGLGELARAKTYRDWRFVYAASGGDAGARVPAPKAPEPKAPSTGTEGN